MTKETIWLDPLLAQCWQGKDVFAAVDALEGEVFRALEGRKTFRTEIAGQSCFVKIHRGVGWKEIIKNLLSLRLPVLGARNEKTAIDVLTACGVPTMRALGFGQRGRNPAHQHSFLITEEIAPSTSLEDVCRDWPSHPPAWCVKQPLLRRVATMARDMHRAGVNHRDFYLCHFLLRDAEALAPAPPLHLIDLHRAQCRARTPERWRRKDLASLYFSALHIGLTRRDWLRFLAIYFDQPWRQVLREQQTLLAWLVREAARLDARFQRKFAR